MSYISHSSRARVYPIGLGHDVGLTFTDSQTLAFRSKHYYYIITTTTVFSGCVTSYENEI